MTEPPDALYHANIERVEMAYLRARAAGVRRPVVLVLDLDDDWGEWLAKGVEPLEPEEPAPLRAPGTVVAAVEATDGVVIDAAGDAHLAEFARLAPAGTFPAVVFAGGGCAGFYRAIPEE
jgi:hypothetical protein